MANSNGSDLLNEGLRLVSFCPVCEGRSTAMEAQLLGKNGEMQLLHLTCRSCRNASIALIYIGESGASSVGLLTDLTAPDTVSFRSRQAISVDDVIDAHALFLSSSFASKFRPFVTRHTRVHSRQTRQP